MVGIGNGYPVFPDQMEWEMTERYVQAHSGNVRVAPENNNPDRDYIESLVQQVEGQLTMCLHTLSYLVPFMDVDLWVQNIQSIQEDIAQRVSEMEEDFG